MKKLLYKAIFWLAKHSPDIIAIPTGKWLMNQLQKERRKRKLNKLADFLLQWEKEDKIKQKRGKRKGK
ncbi:MAG: hypothetical protein AB1397_02995 [bacterium]